VIEWEYEPFTGLSIYHRGYLIQSPAMKKPG